MPGGPFSVEATPDRIDMTPDGAAIIDYKSGGSYSQKGIATGDLPQLSVEGLILKRGGFPGITERKAAGFYYWLMTGASEPGEIIPAKGDAEDIIARTEKGLKKLISVFDDPNTPYYSLPRPHKAPRFNDYEHVARVKEWSALGGPDSEAA
jgi:ATP-dependent helicase/nuclease subunit B